MAKPTKLNVTFIIDLLYDGQLHSSFNYMFPENGAQHADYNDPALGSVFLLLPYSIIFGTLLCVSL